MTTPDARRADDLPRPVLLLDGASLWFRSYFGVPDSIRSPDGRPVNAVRGFLDTVATLITRHRPHRLVVCLDLDWRPAWRVAAIPSYKAHRVVGGDGADAATHAVEIHAADIEEVPDELTPQVGMIADVLTAFGIASAGAPGFEADDVLGTLAAVERHDPVIVASGDRDLLQVVADEPVPVRVFYLGRGLAKAVLFGPAEVARHYGVPAERAGAAYAELALLRGDPSDGLPGVAGIGEKTAAKLLTEFESLAAIRAAVQDPKSALPKAIRAKLLAAGDYVDAAEAVVRVAVDAPVTLDQDGDLLPLAPRDPQRAAALGAELGIDSSVRRLQQALDGLA